MAKQTSGRAFISPSMMPCKDLMFTKLLSGHAIKLFESKLTLVMMDTDKLSLCRETNILAIIIYDRNLYTFHVWVKSFGSTNGITKVHPCLFNLSNVERKRTQDKIRRV